MKPIALILLATCAAATLHAQTTVLIEAESFNSSGGWKADTQSVEARPGNAGG